MAGIAHRLKKLVGRWSRQQDSALSQMTTHKMARKRIAGFSKSERVDAKFYLLALAPFILVMISDEMGLSRGVLWHAWWWLSVVWAIVIFGIGLVSYWRAFRRSLGKSDRP